jgi:phosphatidate cytidylyltransferase
MKWPEDPFLGMIIIVWGLLVISALPLAVLIPVRLRLGKDVKSMWIKYAAWFIMVPAVTIPMLLGKFWMQLAFLAMSLYAFEEYTRVTGMWRHEAHVWVGRICIALAYVPVFIAWYGCFMAMPAFLVLLIFGYPVMEDVYKGMIRCSALTVVGVIYFGWFLAHMAFMMNMPGGAGRQMILAFLVVVVLNDASAYVIGSSFGRRLLSPNLSPGKTVEGFLGAMLVTMGSMFLVRFALGISLVHTLLLGFILSVGGTCGDLTISFIKRDVQVKDSGWLIPGHGGLLDRLDSVLFTAPIFFHFMSYFYLDAW